MKKYNIIDLFSGCGGLLDGFMQTGKYNPVASVEWELKPTQTLAKRLKEKWNISDVDEIYKIATYGKVNEERVSIIKEKNGEYLVSTNDCKIGEKLKLDRVDKYAYEGWLNSNIVKLDEEKQVIK